MTTIVPISGGIPIQQNAPAGGADLETDELTKALRSLSRVNDAQGEPLATLFVPAEVKRVGPKAGKPNLRAIKTKVHGRLGRLYTGPWTEHVATFEHEVDGKVGLAIGLIEPNNTMLPRLLPRERSEDSEETE